MLGKKRALASSYFLEPGVHASVVKVVV